MSQKGSSSLAMVLIVCAESWLLKMMAVACVEFSLALLRRLFDRVDLIKPVSNVCPWIRPSGCPQKVSIQGQGHKPFKVGNQPFSKVICSAIYKGC